jgi:hypothetical protein
MEGKEKEGRKGTWKTWEEEEKIQGPRKPNIKIKNKKNTSPNTKVINKQWT